VTVLGQLSDPHIDVGRGDSGSADALAAAVRAVLAFEPPPDAVLVTGDLTERSDARSYERVRELLARWPHLRRVVAGHVHRAAFGLLGGCPVFACPSTHLQVPLDPAGADIVLEPAPPAFALHALLDGGEVVTHVQPVTAA
jgi:3',5'-cyclic-AMP phosphodiesterase